MSIKTDKIRYAYVKNGDVVTQLMHIAQSDDKIITSGPDAFLMDFLHKVKSNPVFLVGQGLRTEYLEQDNIIAKVINIQPGLFQKIFGTIWAFFSLIIDLLRFKPERILCGRTGSMLWACFLVSRFYSIPLVHSRHNQVIFSSSQSWFKRISSSIDNGCIKRAKNVICHGPYLKDQLEDIGVSTSNIIEFDVGFEDMLSECNDHSSLPVLTDLKNARIILFIGRVQVNKGILDLLDACIPIIKNNPDLKLVYVGSGSGLQTLRQRIEIHGQQSNILLLGEMSHAELAHILLLSHIMVAPTRPDFPEGRCMTVMEALVLGVPVIAPNFGPFPYLVKHNENGLLYTPGSVDNLKEKLDLIIKDQDLYDALKSGACTSGNHLIKPALTFGQAVIHGFE